MRCFALLSPLLLLLILTFFEALAVTEDELDAFLLRIDLKRSVKRFAAFSGHPLHFYRFTLYKFFELFIGMRYTLDFLGNVHPIGTEGDQFVGLRINGNVGCKRLSALGCYLDGFAEIASCE